MQFGGWVVLALFGLSLSYLLSPSGREWLQSLNGNNHRKEQYEREREDSMLQRFLKGLELPIELWVSKGVEPCEVTLWLETLKPDDSLFVTWKNNSEEWYQKYEIWFDWQACEYLRRITGATLYSDLLAIQTEYGLFCARHGQWPQLAHHVANWKGVLDEAILDRTEEEFDYLHREMVRLRALPEAEFDSKAYEALAEKVRLCSLELARVGRALPVERSHAPLELELIG